MKNMKEMRQDVSKGVEKAKGFLSTPKGKAVGAIAVLATVGTAAMLIARARRSR